MSLALLFLAATLILEALPGFSKPVKTSAAAPVL